MGSPFKMKPGSGLSAKNTGKGLSQRGLVPDRGPKMHKGIAHDGESLKNAAREGLLANTPQATSLGFDNSNFDPKSGSYSPKPVKVEADGKTKFLESGNKPYKTNDPKARKAFVKDSTSFANRNKGESIKLNSLMDKDNKTFGM
jgi:hypothetical protein|tara:strand:- start:630 stop:1061 length:432 start_codon:yes stop_codon:yes gene_type:complete